MPSPDCWVPLEVITIHERLELLHGIPRSAGPQHNTALLFPSHQSSYFLPSPFPQTSLNTVNQVHDLPSSPDPEQCSLSSPLPLKSSHTALFPLSHSGSDKELPMRPNRLWSRHSRDMSLKREGCELWVRNHSQLRNLMAPLIFCPPYVFNFPV